MLEGGYDLDALGAGARAVVGALAGADTVDEPASNGGPGRDAVDAVRRQWWQGDGIPVP